MTDPSGAGRAPRVLVSGVQLGQRWSGVQRHNAQLLPRAAALLEARGGGLGVLTGSVPPSFPLPASIALHTSRVPAGPPIARALHEGRALAAALRAAAASGRPYDLVHTAHLPAPRRLPVPWTLTLHDLRSLHLEHTPFSRRFLARHVLGRAIAEAAAVLTVSEGVRAEIEARFRPRRSACIGNGADHLALVPRGPAPGAPLLHVGQIEPRKNLGLLLEALRLDAELPALVLAGAARPGAREALEARAAELGVAARVRFLGPVEDDELARLYAGAACVVLPSLLEGFGIPAVEALRAGAPLAIAAAGALPEVAGDDVPRFAPDDPAACAAAIRAALARAPEAWEPARVRAERHRWQGAAERLVAAWDEAARAGITPPRSAP